LTSIPDRAGCDVTWAERVSASLDGALDAADARALASHLAWCAACRDLAARLDRVVHAVRDHGARPSGDHREVVRGAGPAVRDGLLAARAARELPAELLGEEALQEPRLDHARRDLEFVGHAGLVLDDEEVQVERALGAVNGLRAEPPHDRQPRRRS
jgi:anti-sigma factor RsiW